MKRSWQLLVFLVLVFAGGALVNAWNYLGEVHVERAELKDFPKQIGSWAQEGGDERIDAETMSILRASDYLLRNYRRSDGRIANFYVGYYATQRTGSTYHSPLNCLPGAGWTMTEPSSITISPKGRTPFVANKYLIQNGTEKELLVYWYQGRGRAIASEYWGKIYTVLDSVRLRRSDGAMVRVTIPVGKSESEAVAAAADLAANASSVLPGFIPD